MLMRFIRKIKDKIHLALTGETTCRAYDKKTGKLLVVFRSKNIPPHILQRVKDES